MIPEIVLLVEGPTEEAFVKRVLQPHIGYDSAYLTPIVVHTSRAANGSARRGGGSWGHYRRHLLTLLSQPHWTIVTTLIDFYGYPSDAPKCSCSGQHVQPACVASREDAIRATFPSDQRFMPFLALHEFETLVIAAGATSADVLGNADAARTFKALVHQNSGNAEHINNGPSTAPSKRVADALVGYSKVQDGVAILEDGLGPALSLTPRFRDWVAILQSAAPAGGGTGADDDTDEVAEAVA